MNFTTKHMLQCNKLKKKFFLIFFVIATLILLTNCEKKSNLEELVYFTENIPQIQHYIVRLKTYHTTLVVCSLKKSKNHSVITLEVFYSKYKIENNFKYKNINGINFLFIDYNEKLINKAIPPELIKQNIITFDEKYNNEEPPYLKFFFCENNLSLAKSFDNIQLDELDQQYRRNKKVFNIDVVLGNCE